MSAPLRVRHRPRLSAYPKCQAIPEDVQHGGVTVGNFALIRVYYSLGCLHPARLGIEQQAACIVVGLADYGTAVRPLEAVERAPLPACGHKRPVSAVDEYPIQGSRVNRGFSGQCYLGPVLNAAMAWARIFVVPGTTGPELAGTVRRNIPGLKIIATVPGEDPDLTPLVSRTDADLVVRRPKVGEPVDRGRWIAIVNTMLAREEAA